MEQLIEQLKRIADALEAGNTLTQHWTDLNIQWRQENVEKGEQGFSLSQDWVEWQKQQKIEEREQMEQWQETGIEKLLAARKEQDELRLALQRELLTGGQRDD